MSQYQFLTTKRFFEGQLLRLLNKEQFVQHSFPKIPGYILVKPLKEQTDSDHNSIGIYKNRTGKQVVIKHLASQKNAMARYQLLNEKSMLELLGSLVSNQKLAPYKITFPQLLSFKQREKDMYLVMELVHGRLLRDETSEKKFEVVQKCLRYMEVLSAEIPTELRSHLPRRSTWLQHLTLPIYVSIALAAKPQQFFLYSKMLWLYYTYAARALFTKTQYVLAHKDLHQDNILLTRERITIIDPQVSVLSERFTDLAIVARLYLPELGTVKLKKLIRSFVKTDHERGAFIRLSIYFSFQLMAIKGVDHKFYEGAISHLSTLDKKLRATL